MLQCSPLHLLSRTIEESTIYPRATACCCLCSLPITCLLLVHNLSRCQTSSTSSKVNRGHRGDHSELMCCAQGKPSRMFPTCFKRPLSDTETASWIPSLSPAGYHPPRCSHKSHLASSATSSKRHPGVTSGEQGRDWRLHCESSPFLLPRVVRLLFKILLRRTEDQSELSYKLDQMQRSCIVDSLSC
eukprot:492171-Hanusia_phi.AAC.1